MFEVSLPLEREEVQMDLLPVTNTDTDDNRGRKRQCSPVAESGSLQDLQGKGKDDIEISKKC